MSRIANPPSGLDVGLSDQEAGAESRSMLTGDPNQIIDVRDRFRQLGRDKTILLSTHILQEVEAVASRVLFIHQGQIIFDGSLDELRRKGENLDVIFGDLTTETESSSV